MTSRSRADATVKIQDIAQVQKRVENSWVFLAKDSMFECNDQFYILCLPHPGSGLRAHYCLDNTNKKVYEVAVFNEPYRSWFIGDSVKSVGKFLITTLVNPIFLVLPRLIEDCSTRAVPLEDLLAEQGFDKIVDYVPNLECVADLKGPEEMKAYKYNEMKTLIWLESRVRSVAKVLKRKNIHVKSGAVSATFVTSSKNDDQVDEELYLKYAHGIVSHYLPGQLVELLEKHFNFNTEHVETLSKKRKSHTNEHSNIRKIIKSEPMGEHKENSLTSHNQFGNVSVKGEKQVVLTNKEKARQKAASGTKTISSFFIKK